MKLSQMIFHESAIKKSLKWKKICKTLTERSNDSENNQKYLILDKLVFARNLK